MALANFFEKTATAAAQVLQDFDLAAFRSLLEKSVIGIAFDSAGATSPEGAASLELATSLLARLYPRLALVTLSAGARPMCRRLARQAKAINPDLEISSSLDQVGACLVVGSTSVEAARSPVYIGSRGWVVRLSSRGPVGSGRSANPFGAGAAACFGAANVFRIVFAAQLPKGKPDGEFTISLFDYAVNTKKPANPALRDVDLGEMHLVGLGAIGNGFVWSLARLKRLTGVLHLIDHEKVELTNLQRYVLTGQTSPGAVKVDLAAVVLKRSGLDVRPHHSRWSDYLGTHSDFRLERVAVALDTADDRIAVQASLPRWIANAWTQPDDLGISRHAFIGDEACLACLYLPDGQKPSEDEVVARAIRMPEAVREVRDLLYSNQPIGPQFVQRLAERWGVPVSVLAEYEALSIRTFYIKALCGGALLQAASASDARPTVVPMAFQSALAGIMLAAEVVCASMNVQRVGVQTTTRINVLRPLGRYLSRPALKHPSKRCLCQDEDFVIGYNMKYGLDSDGASRI